jgi:ferredoxin-fold anticodon binding domain-containing protein
MTEEEFGRWRQLDITKKLFSKLSEEAIEKSEGLVWNSYDDPEIVKGYIRAYRNIVNMEFNDLYE